jgi:hypothetical protein
MNKHTHEPQLRFTSLKESLARELPGVLAGRGPRPAAVEAAELKSRLSSLLDDAGADVPVQVLDEEGDVVVQAPRGNVRLYRQAVTGWWLSEGAYSPERAARRVAESIAGEA